MALPANLWSPYVETLLILVEAIDDRDGIKKGHSLRVANYASVMGELLGFPRERQRYLVLAGLLHDLGKLRISEQILGKPGPLTEMEYYLIRKHSEMGQELVERIGPLQKIGPFIRHHHERFDGKGYPDGLAGEGIPLESRILFIAESYDCVRSASVFSLGMSFEQSSEEMRIGSGIQFDPQILRPFLGHIDEKTDYNEVGGLKRLFGKSR